MSFDFNYKFWVATKHDISRLLKRQEVLKKRSPIKNPQVSFKILSEIFVLYVELVDKLSYLYRKTLQVQKRDVIRKLLQPVMGTLVALKNELKNMELSEYIYIDKTLIARKLTPSDLIIWKSPDFLYRRPINYQNFIYGNTIFMDDLEKERAKTGQKNILVTSIVILQAHERARQARVYRSTILYDNSKIKLNAPKVVPYNFIHHKDQSMSIPVKRTVFGTSLVKLDKTCQDLVDNKMHKNIAGMYIG